MVSAAADDHPDQLGLFRPDERRCGLSWISSRPASRGALPIKIGLMLYDWITRHRRLLPKHRFRGARATLALAGAFAGLRFSATYHDAWISYPERLGVELLLDARRLAPEASR